MPLSNTSFFCRYVSGQNSKGCFPPEFLQQWRRSGCRALASAASGPSRSRSSQGFVAIAPADTGGVTAPGGDSASICSESRRSTRVRRSPVSMRHLCGLDGVIVQRSMCVAAVFLSRLRPVLLQSKTTSFAGHEVFIRLCDQSCQLQFRLSNWLGEPSLFGARRGCPSIPSVGALHFWWLRADHKTADRVPLCLPCISFVRVC